MLNKKNNYFGLQNLSLEITICHNLASLIMPNLILIEDFAIPTSERD